MKTRIHNYYVLSLRFNGRGRGFAIGFDSYKMANYFAAFVLVGFADIITDYDLESRFPTYYHNLISHTS